MSNDTTITVEVAYALPHKQALLKLNVPAGTTALAAAQQSGITEKFDAVDLENATLGIFGQVVAPGHVLREGDRVEVYSGGIAALRVRVQGCRERAPAVSRHCPALARLFPWRR